MRNILLAASILSITITGAGNAQGTASSTKKKSSLTNAQIRQMARVAHTPEQYRTVAGNYAGLQEKYLRQAAEEKQEWVRRSQNVPTSIPGLWTPRSMVSNTLRARRQRPDHWPRSITEWRRSLLRGLTDLKPRTMATVRNGKQRGAGACLYISPFFYITITINLCDLYSAPLVAPLNMTHPLYLPNAGKSML